MAKQKYLLPVLALITASVLWGFATSLIKIGLESIPVPIFIATRFFLASMLLLPVALRVWRPMKTSHFLLMVLAAVLDITLSVAAANYGLTMTTASNTGIIFLLMPIVMLVLSIALLKEKLRLRSLVGIFVALVGGLIIIGSPWNGGDATALAGNLLIVLAVFLNALSFVIIKPLTKSMHHYQIAFMNYFVGILPVMIYAATQLDTWHVSETTTKSWIALGIVILISVFSNPLFYYGLKSKAVQNVGVYQYIDPLVTVIAAWFLLGERPASLFYVGGVLIIAGVYIVEKRPKLQKRVSA